MIKELRIGNWIDFKSTPGEYEQVEEIKCNGVAYPSVNRVDMEDIAPIPLTPELLEKAGFTVDDSDEENTWYILKCFDLRFTVDESSKFKLGYLYSGKSLVSTFGCLHQLQNLYHALTGNELAVQLGKEGSHGE